MKFTTVLVMLALALGANASVIPVGPLVIGGPWAGSVVLGHDHAHAHAHALVHGLAHGLAHGHGPAAITVAQSPVHAHGHVIAGPGPVQIVSGPIVAHAHPHVVAAAPVHVPGATFVAKNRGAVHVAPLAGHVQSVVSANLEPAPGTH